MAKGDKCRLDVCDKLTTSNSGDSLCAMHRTRWRRHRSYDLPKKPRIELLEAILKICKIHGELTEEQVFIEKRKSSKTWPIHCKQCRNNSRKASNAKNRDRVRKTDNAHYARTRDRHQELRRIKKFGVTKEFYLKMLSKQNNVCAICKYPETAMSKGGNEIKPLAIDHCHTTNKIRGLLCQSCNTALGTARENRDILLKMIKYLKTHCELPVINNI